MSEPNGVIKIAAVSGSIRSGAYNTGLLRALQQIAERRGTISLELVEGIDQLPHLNPDLLANGVPEPVQRAQATISGADGVIFATPEYSYTLPGVLKNFIDWQALPNPLANPLAYKPVGIVGASIGKFGTYRAQAELRKALHFTDSQVLTKPEVYVSYSGEKFDEAGTLTDQETWGLLERFLDEYEEFARATLRRDLPSKNREYLWT